MDEIEGAHSGEHIGEVFIQIAREYEISDILGFFVMDNTSNNDTFLQHLEIDQQQLGSNFNTSDWWLQYVISVNNIIINKN